MTTEPNNVPPMSREEHVRFLARLAYHEAYAAAREKSAAWAAEASWSRWLSLGCPADRSGVMGVSLLVGSGEIRAGVAAMHGRPESGGSIDGCL